MPVSRRCTPEHPPGESCNYGLDYSFVIPPGVGIVSGALSYVVLRTTLERRALEGPEAA